MSDLADKSSEIEQELRRRKVVGDDYEEKVKTETITQQDASEENDPNQDDTADSDRVR